MTRQPKRGWPDFPSDHGAGPTRGRAGTLVPSFFLSFREAEAAGFPDDMVRGKWTGFREKGPQAGTRKAIKHFTRVSRERLK